jgi:hypothetical protein
MTPNRNRNRVRTSLTPQYTFSPPATPASAEEQARYLAAMTCGQIALATRQAGMPASAFAIDDAEAAAAPGYRSNLIDDITQALRNVTQIDDKTLDAYAYILCATGIDSSSHSRAVGIELARRGCPAPNALDGVESAWVLKMVSEAGFCALNRSLHEATKSCKMVVQAIATALLDRGCLGAAEVESLVTANSLSSPAKQKPRRN